MRPILGLTGITNRLDLIIELTDKPDRLDLAGLWNITDRLDLIDLTDIPDRLDLAGLRNIPDRLDINLED